MLVYKLYNSGSVVICYEKLWYLEVLALRDNLAAEACIAGFFAGHFNIFCFHICDTFLDIPAARQFGRHEQDLPLSLDTGKCATSSKTRTDE